MRISDWSSDVCSSDLNMFDIKRKTIDWAGRPLTLETGRIARQADGAVLATYGETVVLATVVYGRAPKPGLDFFPLTVNYQEKTFAAGTLQGGDFNTDERRVGNGCVSTCKSRGG